MVKRDLANLASHPNMLGLKKLLSYCQGSQPGNYHKLKVNPQTVGVLNKVTDAYQE
jgi:hypothetical protein